MVDLATSILEASLPLSMPILYAAVGEVYAERAGVLNMGVEGVMTLAAFVSLWTTFLTGSYALGALAGIGTGAALGLLHSLATVKVGVNQLIVGLLVYTIGGGIADFAYRYVTHTTVPLVRPLPAVSIPWIGGYLVGIPYIGPMLFAQNLFVYLSIALALVMGFVLYRTTWGLKVRAVGENPEAADAAGINVNLTRHLCVVIGASLAGLGGAAITLGYLGLYNTGDSIVAGRGWIAIVVVIFARWSPIRAILGSWIFGLGYALSATLIGSGGGQSAFSNPYFLLMLPYVFALVVILIFHRGTKPPSSLTVPYKRR